MTFSQTLQNKVRMQPQQVDLKLSIYQPTVALACQVNNSTIARGARTIAFDTVSEGAYTKVRSGMTMLVGTSEGASNKGTIRVRSCSANSMVVAENSNIMWADGLYLTVLQFFDIVPIFPRIIQDEDDPEKIIFYKDYDITYSGQNKKMGTLICMGSHREAELDPASMSVNIYYTANGTTNVNREAMTYSWNFEGAETTTSTDKNPGNIEYKTPGHYLTRLTVTTPTGASDTSYRYVIINSPGGSITDWQMEALQGNRASGGYTAEITIRTKLNFTITAGTAVIISSDEFYGTNHDQVDTVFGQENVFFVGHVLKDSIKYSADQSSVSFSIGTVSELMKLANGFAISVEDTAEPKEWYQIKDLNLRKAMYHFWRWHSTVLLTTDVQMIGIDYLQQFYDCNKESLYDAVSGVLESARIMQLVCNRTGKLYAEVATRATPSSITAFPPEMSINKDDWIREPTIQVQEHGQTAYLEMGGIAYSGPGEETSKPLLACAPGYAPTNRGKSGPITGLVLFNQKQLNTLVGDVFWNDNAKYPSVNMNMRGSYKCFDIAPQQAAQIEIAKSDTVADINIDAPYLVNGMTFDYDHESHTLMSTIEWKSIIDGPDGQTIVVPEIPDDGYSGPELEVPEIPTDWYPELKFPGDDPHPTYEDLLFVLADGNLWYTDNIEEEVPVWHSGGWGAHAALRSGTGYLDFDVNIHGQVFLMENGTYPRVCKGMFDQEAVVVADSQQFIDIFKSEPYHADGSYWGVSVGCDPNTWDVYAAVVGIPYPAGFSYMFRGNGMEMEQKMRLVDHPFEAGGDPSGSGLLSYFDGKWYLSMVETTSVKQALRTMDFALENEEFFTSVSGAPSYEGRHLRPGLSFNNYITLQRNGQLYEDGFETYVSDLTSGGASYGSWASDPSGLYMMRGEWIYGISRSSDRGETWEGMLTPPYSAFQDQIFVCLGSTSRWLVQFLDGPAGTHRLMYTDDFGETWTEKTTEFAALAGVHASITQMRYLP